MSNNQCHGIVRLLVLSLCLLSATAAEETRQSLSDYMRTTLAPTDPVGPDMRAVEPSLAPSRKPTFAPTQRATATVAESSTSLYMTNMEHGVSYGEVYIQFSLFSPNVTNREMNFMKLKLGVSNSINAIICDMSSRVAEMGPDYCAVRADLLQASQSRRLDSQTSETTVMALSSTNVNDASFVTHSKKVVAWTSWKLGWSVIQIGTALRAQVVDQFGANLSDEESQTKATMILQQIVSDEFERILREGVFERGLNAYLEDFMVLTSAVGEEVATYSIVATSVTSSAQGQESAREDTEGGDLQMIFFFGGIGAAIFLIVVLLYISVRHRRRTVPPQPLPKRTIIIVDDTSKTDSERSGSNKVMVFDTEAALKDDPPRGQQDVEANWEGQSSVGDGEARGDAEEATEDQTVAARSMTHSMAHTGSISAITGVSGLEGSDTWSVGSMSIDLAEWG
jgi:hypothetical protein